MRGLPERVDRVAAQRRIGGNQRQLRQPRMRHQHPIHRIAVQDRQAFEIRPDFGGQVEKLETETMLQAADRFRSGYALAKPQIAVFPCNDRADEQSGIGIEDCLDDALLEPPVLGLKPDQNLRIKEEADNRTSFRNGDPRTLPPIRRG